MKQFPFLVSLVFLLLLLPAGTVCALSNTTTTTPASTGGNIFFDTDPQGATIWLENVNIGTSPITYHTDKTGTLAVRATKRLFLDYTGTVTVRGSDRIEFYAVLSPIPNNLMTDTTPVTPATTATIPPQKKSTKVVPTPWPSSTLASPVDPALVIGAISLGFGFMVLRRR